MGKRKKLVVCYLCGEDGASTKDHIFPRGLFPRPRPSNLPTAPACDACHSADLSKDEELFRIFAASGLAYEHPQGKRVWEESVRPDLQGNRPGLRNLIRDLTQPAEIVSREGKHLGDALAWEMDRQRVNNVLVKMAKGLYYQETGSPLPLDTRFAFIYGELDPERLVEGAFLDGLQGAARHQLGEGVVTYWCNTVKDDPRQSMNWLVFYGYNAFLVITSTPEIHDEAAGLHPSAEQQPAQ